MSRFIVNKYQQPNGDHEVHNTTSGCSHMPLPQNQVDLGNHNDCSGAVYAAKIANPTLKINGCYYCCRACHTS